MRYRVQEKVSRSFACTTRRFLNNAICPCDLDKKKKKKIPFYRKVTHTSEVTRCLKNKKKEEGEGRGGEGEKKAINNQFSIDRILK